MFYFFLPAQEVSVLDKFTGSFSHISNFEISAEGDRIYLLESVKDSLWLSDQLVPTDPALDDPLFFGWTYIVSVVKDGTIGFVKNLGFGYGDITYGDSSIFLFLTFSKDTLFTTDTIFVKSGALGSSNMIALEYNHTGELLTAKLWPSPYQCGFNIVNAQFFDERFYIAGQFGPDTLALDNEKIATYFNLGSRDIFLGVFDKSLKCQWLNRMGGNGLDGLTAMTVGGNDKIITTGFFASSYFFCDQDSVENEWAFTNSENMFTAVLDTCGSCQWLTQVKDPKSVIGSGASFLSSGSAVVAGYYNGLNADFGDTLFLNPSTSNNGFFSKYNSDGEFEHASQLLGSTSQNIRDLTVTPDEGIWVCGANFSDPMSIGMLDLPQIGEGDGFVLKYNQFGVPVYATSFGGNMLDYCYLIEKGDNNNVVVVLQSNSDEIEVGGEQYLLKENKNNQFVIEIKDKTTFTSKSYTEKTNLKLFPNPTMGSNWVNYNISGNNLSPYSQGFLYSIQGQLINQFSIFGQEGKFLLPDLPSGIYYIKLYNEINVTLTTEIIIF